MAAVRNALIVGGGIAGMIMAIGLHQKGIHAEVVERKMDWTVRGVGITIQGFAMRALQAVGVLDRCIQVGFPINEAKVGNVEGHVFAHLLQPKIVGPAYPASIGIMRSALHTVLIDRSSEAGTPIRLGLTVVALTQSANSVDVEFSDGTHGTYDLVIGADGIHSHLRELVFGTNHQPQYTGQAVWRATLERLPEVTGVSIWYGPRNKAGCTPSSQNDMYLFLTQNVPVKAQPQPQQLLPLLQEQLIEYRGLIGEIRKRIVDPQQIHYRPIESFLLPTPWYQGRVVVIGDAAHAPAPHLASGAGIAIEDAVVLSQALASTASITQALEQFMHRRYERCRMVVENSMQLVAWEKNPATPNADANALTNQSMLKLAEPI